MIVYAADALNLSSPDAKIRIARGINMRYKRVTSAIGLIPTRREEVNAIVSAGSRYVEFTGIEKVDIVFYMTGGKKRILSQLTNDEMQATNVRTAWPPRYYSEKSIGPQSVTLQIDCTPEEDTTLFAMGLADATTLSNIDEPRFPESFHDILIHGVLADEYRKMEKLQYARDAEQDFERRLSDLKMFIAKSAYLTIYPGKHAKSDGWWDVTGSIANTRFNN